MDVSDVLKHVLEMFKKDDALLERQTHVGKQVLRYRDGMSEATRLALHNWIRSLQKNDGVTTKAIVQVLSLEYPHAGFTIRNANKGGPVSEATTIEVAKILEEILAKLQSKK